ncbi:MAG: DNA repair protein RadA, partial [Cellulosilyticaceae bacterium]
MAKLKQMYVCQQCGYETGKWMGKCPNCNEWGALVEETVDIKKMVTASSKSSNAPIRLKDI